MAITRSMCAVAGSLALSTTAVSDFTGLGATSRRVITNGGSGSQMFDLDVFEVFATFDDAADAAYAVNATPTFPQVLSTPDGFYQALIFGSNPNVPLPGPTVTSAPYLGWDSMLTIGVRQGFVGSPTLATVDPTFNISDFNGGDPIVTTSNGGWGINAAAPETAATPFPPAGVFDFTVVPAGATHGVILMQISVPAGNAIDVNLGRILILENGVPAEITSADPPGLNTGIQLAGPVGACCLSDRTCLDDRTEFSCENVGGTFMGLGTDCASTSCEDVCCFPCCLDDGSCSATTVDDCLAMGGGIAINCDECVQPGACCFDDGTCTQVQFVGGQDCATAGGTYAGDDTTCASTNCPQACCYDNGTCLLVTVQTCASTGGSSLPPGEGCAASPCPEAGACCLFSDECLVLTEAACLVQVGQWSGAGSDCADLDGDGTADACEPCVADLNGDGVVGFADILVVLSFWGRCQ